MECAYDERGRRRGEGMRLAAQVQARTQQRAAENGEKPLLLVSTHEQNLAGRPR